MSRQVLTLPDVPGVLLTQDEGDQRYEPIDSAYTKAESDGLYPKKTDPDPYTQYLTQGRADTRYLQTSNAFTQAQADTRYLQLTGGTLSGTLRVNAQVGLGVAPAAWSYRVLQVGRAALQGHDTDGYFGEFSTNTYQATTAGEYRSLDGAAASARWRLQNGTAILFTAPQVAQGAVQDFTQRLNIAQNGDTKLYSPGFWVGDSGADMGGAIRFVVGGTGARRGISKWLVGMASPATNEALYFYDLASDKTRLLINASGGAATIFQDAGLGSLILDSTNGTHNYLLYNRPNGQNWATGTWASPNNEFRVAAVSGADWPNHRLVAYWDWTYGTLNLVPNGGAAALSVQGSITSIGVGLGFRAAGGGNCSLYAGGVGSYFHPDPDNGVYLGHPGIRWAQAYITNGVTTGSSLDLKEDIAPLDQAACVEAVLGTDWVSFAYKPPEPPGPSDDDARTDEERRAAYETMLAETAPGRHLKGYVLDSPEHRVHDLFGLSDRKNANTHADLAVVACALQQALQRINVLETHILALEAR